MAYNKSNQGSMVKVVKPFGLTSIVFLKLIPHSLLLSNTTDSWIKPDFKVLYK